jgi:hypothetical protein
MRTEYTALCDLVERRRYGLAKLFTRHAAGSFQTSAISGLRRFNALSCTCASRGTAVLLRVTCGTATARRVRH